MSRKLARSGIGLGRDQRSPVQPSARIGDSVGGGGAEAGSGDEGAGCADRMVGAGERDGLSAVGEAFETRTTTIKLAAAATTTNGLTARRSRLGISVWTLRRRASPRVPSLREACPSAWSSRR